jgi:hypothetical protein
MKPSGDEDPHGFSSRVLLSLKDKTPPEAVTSPGPMWQQGAELTPVGRS